VPLKTAAEAAVDALKTFNLIFPERFTIMGMGDEIERLVAALHGLQVVSVSRRMLAESSSSRCEQAHQSTPLRKYRPSQAPPVARD
jgi:diphthamide biosynthesis methyltransferase